MKNYILFSTNSGLAVDNVSLCIETTLKFCEATDKIHEACKYNSFAVTSIGEPMSGCLELDVALEEIRKIRLHQGIVKSVDKTSHVIHLPDGVILTVDRETLKPMLKIDTQFANNDPDVVVKEHAITGKLIEMFSTLGYNKTRSEFSLGSIYKAPTPETNGYRGTYGKVGDDLVYIYEELTMKLEEL